MTAALQFTIAGHDTTTFSAYAVDGTEALSSLYSFDVDCLGPTALVTDPVTLVGQRAILSISLTGGIPRMVFGIIDSVRIERPSIFGDARYRFRLVPGLARLKLSRSNQIHGTANAVSVPDVIEAEMLNTLRSATQVVDSDLRFFDYKIHLKDSNNYPKRDHISQYEETDFDFISRLAENAGIFYFFENKNDRENMIFADDNLFAKVLENGDILQWTPWTSGQSAAAPDSVQQLVQECAPVPKKIWLQDYNYREPHVPLLVNAEVDSRGRGNWVEYGSNHRSPTEGSRLAQIRAEELRCQQSRWHGNSTVARLAPGRLIQLAGHPYAAWNQRFLVVQVRHEVRVPLAGVPASDWVGYRNSFEMIEHNVQFRPARVTPVPRMDGLLNGRIDGAGDGNKAEIDQDGRYRVRMRFDLAGSPDGKGSQWTRLASPFGGDGDGMHFPLFKNTDVVIGCVNGDPDRPVILGAVPNAVNKSVVTSDNSSQNRLVTRSGMGFEMSVSGQAPAGAAPAVATPTANAASSNLSNKNEYARIYVEDGIAGSGIQHSIRLGVKPGASPAEPAAMAEPGALGYAASTGKGADPVARTDMLFDAKAGVFEYTKGQRYLGVAGDLGVKASNELILMAGADGTGDLDISSGGATRIKANGKIHLFSMKDINLEAQGDVKTKTWGKADYETVGDDSTTIYGNRRSHVWGVQTDFFMGVKNTFNLASLNTVAVSATTSVSLALICNLSLGVSFSLFAGARVDLNFAGRVSVTAGANVSVNVGSQNVFTTGLASGSFTGGRVTLINGFDLKKSTGDIVMRDLFAIIIDAAGIEKVQFSAKSNELDAKLKGATATLNKLMRIEM